MDSIDLKFISAYWCNEVSPAYEERFSWSDERAFEAVMEIGVAARELLVVLAQSIPGEAVAANFAAGPLENYINLIIQEKDADEAAFITSNPYLFRLLPLVWGKVEELGPLAQTSHRKVRFQELHPEKELKTLGVKELMGFWCRISGSSTAAEYDGLYNKVLKKLLNDKSRDAAIHDITISSPDEGLLKYVKENVFVLQER